MEFLDLISITIMKWKTAITNVAGNKETIRGYNLTDLIEKKSFVETIFLLLKGELPNDKETKMLDALFTAAIDHGPGTASAMTARIVVSAKNSLHTAVAAGILAMGELHGSAIEGAAKFFQEHVTEKKIDQLVKELKERKARIAGYGHAVLTSDERSHALFATAKKIGFYGPHCRLAQAVEKSLTATSSKALPLNIDGAMAAILSDMGFAWPIMKGFFLIARVPGLVAQTYEEMTQAEGLRRLSNEEIDYIGPWPRAV